MNEIAVAFEEGLFLPSQRLARRDAREWCGVLVGVRPVSIFAGQRDRSSALPDREQLPGKAAMVGFFRTPPPRHDVVREKLMVLTSSSGLGGRAPKVPAGILGSLVGRMVLRNRFDEAMRGGRSGRPQSRMKPRFASDVILLLSGSAAR